MPETTGTKPGARGYSWPPFEPGNTASQTHGADSDRKVRPVADELAAWLADVAPWTTGPAYAATASAWCWAEARCRLIRSWLDSHEVVNDEGEVPNAATYLERIEARAERLRSELGLGPLALAKLLGALSSIDGPAAHDGLEAMKRAGAEIRRQRDAQALEAAQEGAS